MEHTLSVQEVRAWFDRNGLTIREWARMQGFAPAQVYAVLSGRARGRNGAAHAIAVALGLKVGPLADDTSIRPVATEYVAAASHAGERHMT